MENSSPNPSETAPVSPVVARSPLHTSQGSKFSTIFLVMGGLLLLGLAMASGYYLGRNSVQNGVPYDPRLEISPSPPIGEGVSCTLEAKICPDGSAVGRSGPNCEFTPCPTTSTTPNSAGFKTRLFDPTQNWFMSKPYPKEVTAMTDSQLVGLNCSERYSVAGDGGGGQYFAYSQTGEAKELTDPNLISQVQLAEKTLGQKIDNFISCKTSDQQTILQLNHETGGGGGNNLAFFGRVEGGTFIATDSVPNPGLAYFGCQLPLQLTKTGQIFFQCGGGDGGAGGSAIYKIDLKTKQVTSVLFCTSSSDRPEPVCK